MGGDPGECPGGGFGYGPAAENVTFKVRSRRLLLQCDPCELQGGGDHLVATRSSGESGLGDPGQPRRGLQLPAVQGGGGAHRGLLPEDAAQVRESDK